MAAKTKKKTEIFTAEERAAMKALVKERKAGADRAAGEKAVQAAIAAMPEPDRALGKKLHALITAQAPQLWPKTWYGMPAYAKNGEDIVCFFQNASKFKARYATLGFSDKARLDDGELWPTAFALKTLTPAEEKKIGALLKRALG